MRIKDIEKNFETIDTLDKVLESCQEDIDRIDHWADLLKEGLLKQNPTEAQEGLNELTGRYMRLNPVYHFSLYYADKIENLTRNQIRIDCEKEGKKYTTPMDAQGKISARVAATPYYRIVNILRGYVEDCRQGIGSIQSLLKDLREEAKLAGRTEN